MREIIKSPNHILSTKTRNVTKVDKDVLSLVNEMWAILEGKGVGLAAPQIGEGLNLAVIGFEPTKEQIAKGKTVPVPKIVLINPKISWKSKEEAAEKEGCLSVDKTEVSVSRSKKIHLEYCDQDLKRHKLKAKGYLARIIQHEVDHLNGILITDYI